MCESENSCKDGQLSYLININVILMQVSNINLTFIFLEILCHNNTKNLLSPKGVIRKFYPGVLKTYM